jgi:hypothetical protein
MLVSLLVLSRCGCPGGEGPLGGGEELGAVVLGEVAATLRQQRQGAVLGGRVGGVRADDAGGIGPGAGEGGGDRLVDLP